MRRTLKYIYWTAGAILLAYYLLLGVSVRFGLDMSWMWLCAGAALVAAGFGCGMRLPRWLRIGWRTILCASIALVIVLEGFVLAGMNAAPPDGLDYLIVLGAKVNGDQPSLALEHRIAAAAEYLQANPGTVAIASGGRGSDEGISEAQCIRDGLVAAGIDEGRILMEDQSRRTSQNLKFSRDLIGDPETRVGLVTNNFHVFRATRLAQKAGYARVYGLAAPYGGLTLPHYMVREAACTVADFFLGNL